jgi:2'-5' RNA ligase
MHLTLHFLGQQVPRVIDEALRTVRAHAFRLRLTEPGYFRLAGGRKILWYGTDGGDALVDLHLALARALAPTGFEPERRQFRPHVTLARLTRNAGNRVVADFMQRSLPEDSRAFDCERFCLFASETLADGPRYRIVATYPLLAD